MITLYPYPELFGAADYNGTNGPVAAGRQGAVCDNKCATIQ
jgi:hypothetical protein